MTTKERLETAIKKLTKCREDLLNEYLLSLERPDWTPETSMQAINTAGRLSDCDRHITNLQLELKREQTSPSNSKKEAVSA